MQLGACQQTLVLVQQQTLAKDTEIKALKKKPKFLKRVEHVAEEIAIAALGAQSEMTYKHLQSVLPQFVRSTILRRNLVYDKRRN